MKEKNRLRYNSFHIHLKEKFGCKVYKVSLDAGFTCPNRINDTGCVYCCPSGSGEGAFAKKVSIEEQMQSGIQCYTESYNAEKFMPYFQAFTNTNLPVNKLKKIYDSALVFKDVVGLCIGTRPDCIDESKISLLEEYSKKYYVWLEYGMQSVHDKTLEKINRGHTLSDLIRAVEITKNRGISICLHVILGLPGETYEDMMQTASVVAGLGIDGLKIHLLHVVKGSVLEQWYNDGRVSLMDEETYIKTVCDFLEVIPKTILIQRLTGERRSDFLVAPKWCLEKNKVLYKINQELIRRKSYQGIKA